MRRAIALAAAASGTTSPNPVVGCVLLDRRPAIVGEGFHAYAGGPHAEVVALAEAGERARGGTAVVTLEPCNHTGRTGPCTQALIRAGVARVVFAVDDPTRTAAAAAQLRAAGVEVEIRRARAGRRGRQRRLADPGPPRRGRTSSGSSPPPSTAGRPPPTAPACGSPAEARPTCTGCAAEWTRSSSASAPCSPTTRS